MGGGKRIVGIVCRDRDEGKCDEQDNRMYGRR
jgi:hypothetical protein